ncbi:uncharacterized protein LOC135171056 [Diachasmimorpha longicaudata]|uniref:uncharacterized protein LOC135171056 n=1 Tax=Diachasmimorpha longicaudata TaxID=58733 RepID=UPI0030B8DA8E
MTKDSLSDRRYQANIYTKEVTTKEKNSDHWLRGQEFTSIYCLVDSYYSGLSDSTVQLPLDTPLPSRPLRLPLIFRHSTESCFTAMVSRAEGPHLTSHLCDDSSTLPTKRIAKRTTRSVPMTIPALEYPECSPIQNYPDNIIPVLELPQNRSRKEE